MPRCSRGRQGAGLAGWGVRGSDAAGRSGLRRRAERVPAIFQKTKMCWFHVTGACARGDGCRFAHEQGQLQSPPDLSRTKLCRTLIATGVCNNRACSYAHSREELRAPPCGPDGGHWGLDARAAPPEPPSPVVGAAPPAVCGTAAPQQHGRTTLAGNLGLQRSFGCRLPSSEGSAYESEGSTVVPLGYHADGTHERFSFQSEASERVSVESTACGTPLAETPGRWTFGSEASTAPNVPLAGFWGCPPPPMCCPSDAVLCDLSMHDHRAVAPPELVSSDDEEEEEDEEEEKHNDFPSEILIYPATDDEGEPQVKAARELWPVPAPKPRRNFASTPTAVLGQASASPGPSARVRTHSCEVKQQAAGQAAPPVVARVPPRIHTFLVAKQTVAAPATAARTAPSTIHSVPVAKETLATSATATSVGVAKAQETHAHAAHERKASWKARRASQPRITTLVVRNLHPFTSQQEFLDEVNCSGFAEKYDFAYLPRNFEDGSGKGLAFINFKSAEAASTFAAAWHRRDSRLSTSDAAGQVVPLNVSNASLQGLEANLRQWTCARVTRVKNFGFLPFVLRRAEPEDSPEPAAVAATRSF